MWCYSYVLSYGILYVGNKMNEERLKILRIRMSESGINSIAITRAHILDELMCSDLFRRCMADDSITVPILGSNEELLLNTSQVLYCDDPRFVGYIDDIKVYDCTREMQNE